MSKIFKKSGFSLIELIFSIVIIGIIASFAVPKLMNIRDDAVINSIKQDITTITTSIQNYYISNGKIEKISDAVNINSKTWNISDLEVIYKDGKNTCVSIKISSNNLILTINESAGNICKKIVNSGITTTNYNLQ